MYLKQDAVNKEQKPKQFELRIKITPKWRKKSYYSIVVITSIYDILPIERGYPLLPPNQKVDFVT